MLATILTQTVNQLLACDAEMQHSLQALAGRCIAIEILGWEQKFYLTIERDKLTILAYPQGPTDAVIKGTLVDLLQSTKLFQQGQKNFSPGITVEGDIELVQQFAKMLQKFQIDWEELLADKIGDSKAHMLGNGIRQLWQQTKHTQDVFTNNLTEYLHEEAYLFPTQEEVEDFYQAVATMRDDVERMDARLERLQRNNS